MTFCSSRTRTARKHHRCQNCWGRIAPGTQYEIVFVAEGGDAWSYKTHIDCSRLAERLWKDQGLGFDEPMPWLYEEAHEEIAEYRGEYPHVICRLELQRELAVQAALARAAQR